MQSDTLLSPSRARSHVLTVENVLLSVSSRLHALRDLRSIALEMAYALSRNEALVGLVLLIEPEISGERLAKEKVLAKRVLRPQVMDRLHIVVVRDGEYEGMPGGLPPKARQTVDRLVRSFVADLGVSLPRPDYSFVIRQILILQWIRGAGPVTADWLGQVAGCSYPTVARALKPLGRQILRHTDRKLELRGFPAEEWARMVAVSDRARGTVRFADRSGRPRSVEKLLGRCRKLGDPGVGVGGVLAARRLWTDLDLVGAARLDLSVHCPGGTRGGDLGFVERLDPALKRVEDSSEPAVLAVHFVRRHESFFETDADGSTWADPVECLLDLHEGRFEVQAMELLEYLKSARGGKRR